MGRLPRKVLTSAAAAATAVAVAGGCSGPSTPPVRNAEEIVVPVGAVPAERASIRAVVYATGRVVPDEGGEFLAVAPEAARIVDVLKKAGDPVASGDLLVRFDLPSATQELARLNADLTAGQALLENARINQSRMRDFVARGLVPRRDAEVADRELADAEANVERLRRALDAAASAAERALVHAPFTGIVADRRHEPGDMVTSREDPVLRVIDPRRLQVVASVASADAARVVPGAPARIAPIGGRPPAVLRVAGRLHGSGSADEVQFRLLFESASELPVDTTVAVEIDAEERADVVLIPAEALIRTADDVAVMVAAGTRAERRVVQTGIEDGDRIEIISGVRAGELVVTRGQVGLEDGAAITAAIGSR